MMFALLLVIAASLVYQASCQFGWDPSRMVIFRADDGFATAYELRGNDVMCLLMSTDFGAGRQMISTRTEPSARSDFIRTRKTGWESLVRTWYWRQQDPLPRACNFEAPWAQTIREISPSVWPWECHRYVHTDPTSTSPMTQQSYSPDTIGFSSHIRYATGGSINGALLRTEAVGFIIFQPGNRPRVAAKKNWGRSDEIKESELPDFRRPADFMFWHWYRTGDAQFLKNIKYCGQQEVNDGPTLKLIARYLLERSIFDLEEWPAAASSPAASECAAFLWQHKPKLGIKYIVNVKVFRGALFRGPNGIPQRLPQMLFEIADVPANLIKADPADDWRPPPARAVPGVAPQPDQVVPGPSTPRPAAPQPPQHEETEPDLGILGKRDSKIIYEVKQDASGKNLVRSHIFRVA